MTRALVTLGIPAAGKSTWAEETGLPVVSLDRLRSGGHGLTVLRRAVLELDAHLRAGRDVVVDACNLLPEQRRRWLDVVDRFRPHAEPHLIVFDVPLAVALDRNAQRRYPVPAARVSSMRTEFEAALLAVDHEPWATVCDVEDEEPST